MLNLIFQHSNQLAQEVHEVLLPTGHHEPFEQFKLECRKSRINMRFIFKSGF